MNYKPEVFNDVFTLAHEAGHSMHTWYSARHQPYQYYGYTIFVAEVASTFNEELLAITCMETRRRRQGSGPISSTTRSTTSAPRSSGRRCSPSSRKITHDMAESGEPLTVQALKDVYANCLRRLLRPRLHARRRALARSASASRTSTGAFYVYKYATGLSAAIALSQRVLNGGKKELDRLPQLPQRRLLANDPLDLLRDAGVDMETARAGRARRSPTSASWWRSWMS